MKTRIIKSVGLLLLSAFAAPSSEAACTVSWRTGLIPRIVEKGGSFGPGTPSLERPKFVRAIELDGTKIHCAFFAAPGNDNRGFLWECGQYVLSFRFSDNSGVLLPKDAFLSHAKGALPTHLSKSCSGAQ